jgi:RNA methyltransferase, TrmH family
VPRTAISEHSTPWSALKTREQKALAERRKLLGMAVSATTISSRTNTRVKQLRAAFQRNDRLARGLLAIEGGHLVEEALRSGIVPEAIFLTERQQAPAGLPHSVEIVWLTPDVFSSAVETRSPQGIAALLQPPQHQLPDLLKDRASLLIVAAGLQDPGNLGTILRSAEAFGATGVITTDSTVSPWNQKALRASVGSAFRMPIVTATIDEIASLRETHSMAIFAAVPEGSGAVAVQDADLRGPSAILIGNEGSGLSPEWIALASEHITIPCPGPVESLNAAVAASLLLYEASRQRTAVRTGSISAGTVPAIPGPLRRRPTGATR